MVFGVSTDSIESHRRLSTSFTFPFPCFPIQRVQIVKDYNFGWKRIHGKKSMGVERSTFVIDGNGRIAAIFRKVKPEQHVDLVRGALATLARTKLQFGAANAWMRADVLSRKNARRKSPNISVENV